MSPEDVAQFLHSNPDFFGERPDLLAALLVPHPHGGRAIPLVERQLVSLREKLKATEGRLAELVRFADENDAISEKVHRLSVAIGGARDFPALAQSLYFQLREDFAVPHVALRIWGKPLPANAPEGAAVGDAPRSAGEALGGPHCGEVAGSPFLPWFGDLAASLKSMAVLPLGVTRPFGVLALASEDPQRFHAGMGTLFLRRIGELAAAGIAARL